MAAHSGPQVLGAGDRTVQDGDYLAGRYLLLRKGARDYALVRVAG